MCALRSIIIKMTGEIFHPITDESTLQFSPGAEDVYTEPEGAQFTAVSGNTCIDYEYTAD